VREEKKRERERYDEDKKGGRGGEGKETK